eukprot:4486405-Pleurochrysis_carterae.AAC.1
MIVRNKFGKKARWACTRNAKTYFEHKPNIKRFSPPAAFKARLLAVSTSASTGRAGVSVVNSGSASFGVVVASAGRCRRKALG